MNPQDSHLSSICICCPEREACMIARMSSSSSSEELWWSCDAAGLVIQEGERDRPRLGLAAAGERCRRGIAIVRAPNADSAAGDSDCSRQAPTCLPKASQLSLSAVSRSALKRSITALSSSAMSVDICSCRFSAAGPDSLGAGGGSAQLSLRMTSIIV